MGQASARWMRAWVVGVSLVACGDGASTSGSGSGASADGDAGACVGCADAGPARGPDDAGAAPGSEGAFPGDAGASEGGPSVDPNAFYVAPGGDDLGPGTLDRPFRSLEKAQASMRAAPARKTCYLRAGTYPRTATLTLVAADDGETWSYFPHDAVDGAILDGGARGPNTGIDLVTILGGSNITLDGLTFRNFRSWGVGIHGGNTDPPGGFPVTTVTSDHVAVLNSVFDTGYTTANSGWAGGGVWAQGQVTNLTVRNNVVQHQFGSGLRFGANGDGASPNDTLTGLDVENNVILDTDTNTGDNGAIYTQDQNFASTGIVIRNNFIRDYQGRDAIGNDPARDVAIYLDRGASNHRVVGNVIAATANAIALAGGHSTQCFFVGSGHDNTFRGNVCDLGASAWVLNVAYAHYLASDPAMTLNVFEDNIFLGSWSGAQRSGFFGVDGVAYAVGGAATSATVRNNDYFNYGGGAMATTGNGFGDASPLTIDPQISGWDYALSPASPLLAAPAGFVAIAGGFGPPGYVLPHDGTAPSSPH